jgi:4-carboxymuconolactone decarboxylase
MEQDRYQRGLAVRMEYTQTGNSEISTHSKIDDDFNDIAPDIAKYIIEFGYGDIYSRPGLTKQQRALVTIASLATQGTERQLELHINTGLTAGLTKTEIVEAIMHMIPYTGFPRVLNAIYVAKKVFAQRDPDNQS